MIWVMYRYFIIMGLCLHYVIFCLLFIHPLWHGKIRRRCSLYYYLFMESMYFSNFIPINFLLIYSAVIVIGRSFSKMWNIRTLKEAKFGRQPKTVISMTTF